MHANNEVGTLQPIAKIATIAREHEVLCHSDAAQSVGKVPVDVEALGVDLLSVAGHKFYGPKGVGALFVREGVHLEPLLHGAGHEAGRQRTHSRRLKKIFKRKMRFLLMCARSPSGTRATCRTRFSYL